MTHRLLGPADQADWLELWRAYLRASNRELPEQISALTWHRFLDPVEPMQALGGFDETGRLAGFAHIIFHRSCWQENATCYLEDLFVDPAYRGKGFGSRLVEAAIATALESHAARIYWITHEDNSAARRLYDAIVPRSGFIHYRLKLLG